MHEANATKAAALIRRAAQDPTVTLIQKLVWYLDAGETERLLGLVEDGADLLTSALKESLEAKRVVEKTREGAK